MEVVDSGLLLLPLVLVRNEADAEVVDGVDVIGTGVRLVEAACVAVLAMVRVELVEAAATEALEDDENSILTSATQRLHLEKQVYSRAQYAAAYCKVAVASAASHACCAQSRIPYPKLTFAQRQAPSDAEHPRLEAEASSLLMHVCYLLNQLSSSSQKWVREILPRMLAVRSVQILRLPDSL